MVNRAKKLPDQSSQRPLSPVRPFDDQVVVSPGIEQQGGYPNREGQGHLAGVAVEVRLQVEGARLAARGNVRQVLAPSRSTIFAVRRNPHSG